MLRFDSVTKLYVKRGLATRALDAVSLTIEPGEFVAVVGPSGSGKSTLLHLAAGLDLPSEGRVCLGDRDLSALSEAARTDLRRTQIGLVFQFFNLLPTLTIARNVALPALLDGRPARAVHTRADELLQKIGLRDRAAAYPDELSGGEMQRVAIARALMTDPALLLADEPTGNLDTATGDAIMALLSDSARRPDRTTVLVTHDMNVAARADRIIKLRDGRLVSS